VTLERLGVILNGVTGRMGYRQHLVRSVLAIRDEGGVRLSDGSQVVPDPILVGRNERKLGEIAARHGLKRWTTDLVEALAEPGDSVYFDAQVTGAREASIKAALNSGKHVYTEKPLALTLDAAVELAGLAKATGLCNGVVQDKLFLPGVTKLRTLKDAGFFGRIISVRGEFGYWVFEGNDRPSQRPSWNYRKEEGGGIVLDMFSHWSYLLDQLFGRVLSVTARAATHIPHRWDDAGGYRATADDAAYAIFELADGVVAQINSSWCVRVYRDELLEIQVDGTDGSAVAGLHHCRTQDRRTTPLAVWDPEVPLTESFRDQWRPVPDAKPVENAFKVQWEAFIRHLYENTPFPHDFLAGARGVQLAEAGLRSSAEGRRIDLSELG
jgi:predicted dehydrogenase